MLSYFLGAELFFAFKGCLKISIWGFRRDGFYPRSKHPKANSLFVSLAKQRIGWLIFAAINFRVLGKVKLLFVKQ